jgi:hypothetical protein
LSKYGPSTGASEGRKLPIRLKHSWVLIMKILSHLS